MKFLNMFSFTANSYYSSELKGVWSYEQNTPNIDKIWFFLENLNIGNTIYQG